MSWVPQECPPESLHSTPQHPTPWSNTPGHPWEFAGSTHMCMTPLRAHCWQQRREEEEEASLLGYSYGKVYTHGSSSGSKVHLQANRKDFRWPGFMETQEPKLIRTPLPERQNYPQLRAQLEERCHNPFFIWSLFSGGLESRTSCLSTITGSSWATPPPFRGSSRWYSPSPPAPTSETWTSSDAPSCPAL